MDTRPVESLGDSPSVHGGPDRVRQAALDAAERLFARRGINAVSVREIAREVGVSHTLLHLYFGSKDEIVRQVLASRNGDHAAVIRTADGLADGVEQALAAVLRDGDWLRVVAASLVEGGTIPDAPTLRSMQAAFLERVGGEAGASGDGGVDPRVVSVALVSMALGWAVGGGLLRVESGLEGVSDDELVEQLAKVAARLVQGLD